MAIVAFSYPFHPRQDPSPGDRVARLAAAKVPVFVGQGTRDSRGNRQQVRGYPLPPHVQIHWLEDANHGLAPRRRSGHTQAEQLRQAAQAAVAFLQRLP